ncbi:SMP-30/gluconolactonase/LRE family protein [Rugamonas sp. CCM 8940]|uniref:SMP-30/gluconolactonase/LRE family protein n=1 Tax=Rugamonas sp. CCM 8940 TaxID=2765359 RepID=UPI0018F32728|nr:SMP-30/gluconolactonase/LRE family protein [Rugamonas sp. CCM 8940]MBJ7311041.1 SMP-30/gluconolactonase/LRE family protein [Rugamonas sp. CCM 8940]
MSKPTIETVSEQAMQVGECPLWHPEEQALYWVDIEGFAVHRLDPASGARREWKMSSEPSALARSVQGGLLVALRRGFVHLNTETGTLTDIAAAPYDTATTRFNDGRADAAGRFWVGTIFEPRDRQGAEMFVLERGEIRKVWSGGMTVSNGLGFSPDQRTLYHADTTAHRITRYAFDLAGGTVAEPRLLKQFSTDKANNYGGRPDGAAVDSEGNYWCAMFEGGRVLKLSPGGEILDEIALPLRCPTMLAFGGADLRTLYITSASYKRPAEELARHPLSGHVLSLRVDVAGRAEPAYIE